MSFDSQLLISKVNELMQQVADRHGLDISVAFPQAGVSAPIRTLAAVSSAQPVAMMAEADDLSRRLAELKSRG